MAWQKFHGQINRWKIVMIASTSTQKHSYKVWTDSFVYVKLHSRHYFSFADCIEKLSPDVKTVETADFRNHDGSFYNYMPSFWKKTTLMKRRWVIFIINWFDAETPDDKSPWKMKNVLSLISLFSLDQITKIKIINGCEIASRGD